LVAYRGQRPSPEQFVADASKPGEDGKPGQVKVADGKIVTVKEWLTAELAEVRKELR